MRGPHPSLAVAAALLRAPERTEPKSQGATNPDGTLLETGGCPLLPATTPAGKSLGEPMWSGNSASPSRLLEGPGPDFSPRSPLASECLDAGHMLGQQLGTRFLGSYLELAVIPEEIFLLSVSRPHGTSWAPRSPGVDSMPCLWLPGWLGSATLSL